MRLLILAIIAWRVYAPCSDLQGYARYREHLEEKLGNPNGAGDAGADVVRGGSAAFLYLSCDDVDDTGAIRAICAAA